MRERAPGLFSTSLCLACGIGENWITNGPSQRESRESRKSRESREKLPDWLEHTHTHTNAVAPQIVVYALIHRLSIVVHHLTQTTGSTYMMRAMLPTLQQPLRLSMAARHPQLRMIAGGSRAFQTSSGKAVAASSQGRKYLPVRQTAEHIGGDEQCTCSENATQTKRVHGSTRDRDRGGRLAEATLVE